MTKKRILLVEDDDQLRPLLDLVLSNTEYQIAAVCNSGHGVTEAIRFVQPDLVLLDFSLPIKDGLTVLKELRGSGYRLPILMYSGCHDDHRVVQCMNSGANGFLLKHSGFPNLNNAIKAIFSGEGFWIDERIRDSIVSRCAELLAHA
jgi:two-component system, NarL family, response regulator EvgA